MAELTIKWIWEWIWSLWPLKTPEDYYPESLIIIISIGAVPCLIYRLFYLNKTLDGKIIDVEFEDKEE